jgi:hypothetical protein
MSLENSILQSIPSQALNKQRSIQLNVNMMILPVSTDNICICLIRYRGRLSVIIWYGVWEGSDGPKSLLLRNLRLTYVYGRRMQRTLAMDRRGTVAVVEEAF